MDTDYDAKEALADYAHETWSGWMRYLFERSHRQIDGSVRIPPDLVKRWERQMRTPYADLPEEEKKSDRLEALHILAIVHGKDTPTADEPDPGAA